MWAAASVKKKKKKILNADVQKPNLVLFYLMLPDLRKRTAFLEISQDSSICPGKSCKKKKKSVELW
jgi:hypothetical protein